MALPHKIKDNNTNDVDVLPSDNDQWFSDGQLDVIAAVLAETRAELRDEWQAAIDKAVTELRGEKDLHEAIAELRGQLAAVMNLFGNGPKLFEAEQTVRKLKISAGEGGGMNLAVAYARLAASPDFAEQTKLAALRAEHRKQLTDAKAKFGEETTGLRQELATARRELNALRTHNEWYARKLKTYDGIAQLIAAAARTEPVR